MDALHFDVEGKLVEWITLEGKLYLSVRSTRIEIELANRQTYLRGSPFYGKEPHLHGWTHAALTSNVRCLITVHDWSD